MSRPPLSPNELNLIRQNWKRSGRGCLLALILSGLIWSFFLWLAFGKG